MATSSQKFIGRNRAPRVQIEYDLETYDSEKKIQLPFVMGVMSDLSGQPEKALPPVEQRKFIDIDVDTFDKVMREMKVRTVCNVDNTLTDEGGKRSVVLKFSTMDDFSPAAIARNTPGLSELLEMRQQLANLITYMDGKSGAEALIAKVVKDPMLLKALASAAKPAETPPAAADGPADAAPAA
jgi:type VI secretion system protein ImpB